MPIVAIDLSEDETARVDAVAEREKRARKAQVHILALIGLEVVEAEQAAKLKTEEAPQS
ncbi:MAG: hypothetical protein ACOVMP_00855 [Chthoniobacterales bacterium]